ncbi:MAG: tRNA (adenosine(37)-N6)-threonylcarbamoyltransferase complex ATPase subunit type 1 TsaE, partial [Candidatus Magasanikbacteria bacterium CG10_big_fil_rev_8_21_14_0_10_43_6]
MKYTTHSFEETIAIGEKIASLLKGGDIVLLKGNLGAGKTTLVKGIAAGLGIKKDDIT